MRPRWQQHRKAVTGGEAASTTSELERSPDSENVSGAFERSINEGDARASRTLPALIATGLVGGLDVGVGVLALLLVHQGTDNEWLGALAFPIGFVALTLGNSELFTENFLVPVAAVVARRIGVLALVRLWGGTLVANLFGGWLVAVLIAGALPQVTATADTVSRHYIDDGVGWVSFASALLSGMIMTLMTWLLHSTPSVPARLAAAYALGFVLAAGPLHHSIVGSLEQFVALIGGSASFGYADWTGFAAWTVLGNLIGGIGLVTTLRLVQAGLPNIERERQRSDNRSD